MALPKYVNGEIVCFVRLASDGRKPEAIVRSKILSVVELVKDRTFEYEFAGERRTELQVFSDDARPWTPFRNGGTSNESRDQNRIRIAYDIPRG